MVQVLARATTAPFRHWRYVLLVMLPGIALLEAAITGLVIAFPSVFAAETYDVGGLQLAGRFTLAGLQLVLSAWIAIGWHRYTLIDHRSLAPALAGPPVFRYILRLLVGLALSVAVIALVIAPLAIFSPDRPLADFDIVEACEALLQGPSSACFSVYQFYYGDDIERIPLVAGIDIFAISLVALATGQDTSWLGSWRRTLPRLPGILVSVAIMVIAVFSVTETATYLIFAFDLVDYGEGFRYTAELVKGCLYFLFGLALLTEWYRELFMR